MFDGSFRKQVDGVVQPIGNFLFKLKLNANVLTLLGVGLGLGSAFAIAQGRLLLGFFLLLGAGAGDLLDGPLSKAAGKQSMAGAFFDSFSDRMTDAFIFCGLAWYMLRNESVELFLLPVAIMAVTQLVSYQRAKAESLQLEAKGGLMERAERFIVLLGGLLFSSIFFSSILIIVLWVLLALVSITAVSRFVKILRQAIKES